MLLTPDQLERACGFLLLNEFNAFSYCCKICISEFNSGAELEAHVLEHQDSKTGFENILASPNDVFESTEPSWNGADEQLMTVDDIKQEIKPAILEQHEFENNCTLDCTSTTDNGILGVFLNETRDSMVKNELIELNVTENQCQRSGRKKQTPNTKDTTNTNIITMTYTVQPELLLDSNKYYCELCPFTEVNFIRKSEVLRHLRQHFAVRKECPICQKVLPYLYIHMKQEHSGIDPYKCTFCERTFKKESAKLIHMRTHTGEKPFLCSTCGDAFKTFDILNKHIERIHKSGIVLPYSCTECDSHYQFATQYEKHRLEKHDDNRPHACIVCGNRFRNKEKLRRHKLIHDEKRFPCKYCGKKFQTGDVKRLHERKMHEEVNWKKKKDDTAKKRTTVNQQMDSDQRRLVSAELLINAN